MVGATKSRTLADDERIELLQEIGCIVSVLYFKQWGTPGDIDHLLYGGNRHPFEPHQHTICLRPWYHRGDLPDHRCGGTYDEPTAIRVFGPSRARHPRAFQERFGDGEYLLKATDALIAAMVRAGRGAVLGLVNHA